MGNVGEHFKDKNDKTLEELKSKLSKTELQEILYSLQCVCSKEDDGKIHFHYVDVPEETVKQVRAARRALNIEDEEILVMWFEKRMGKGKVYTAVEADKVAELKPYLRK